MTDEEKAIPVADIIALTRRIRADKVGGDLSGEELLVLVTCTERYVTLMQAAAAARKEAVDRETRRLLDVIARLDAEIAQYIDANVNMRARLAAAEAVVEAAEREHAHDLESVVAISRDCAHFRQLTRDAEAERDALKARVEAMERVVWAVREDVSDCHYCGGSGLDPQGDGWCPTCGRLKVALVNLDARKGRD